MSLGSGTRNQSGVYRPAPDRSADDLDSTSHSSHNCGARDFLGSLYFCMVLLYVGACTAVSGGADQLEVVVAVAPHPKKVTMAAVALTVTEVVVAVAPHPKKVTMAAVALTVAAVALADSRKLLNKSTHLGDLAVAAVELADQHNDSLRLEPAAVAHHHGMRIEPASMADHHEPASKEG